MILNYDYDFPETADVARLNHNRLREAAMRIKQRIEQCARCRIDRERDYLPGLRSALRIMIDADRDDDD